MAKVVKFGGSSLADANQFRKVADIIRSDKERRYVVPSAPGKRFSDDTKVTDMLYKCYDDVCGGANAVAAFLPIAERYNGIIGDLGLTISLDAEYEEITDNFTKRAGRDYAASRGEYLNGIILANYLGFNFVDAARAIFSKPNGEFDAELTDATLASILEGYDCAVIPGFYGANPDGSIRTFSRGGSDITGALVARAVNADVYENWTDVSGFLMADPRIIDSPAEISSITYKELRELSHMGASVLHEDAMFPVHRAGIPTNIRNTNKPYHPGTMISRNAPNEVSVPTITGIAGHKGYSVISVEKNMMNSEVGFGRKVLSVLEDYGISFEHMPTGIDSMCVVVNSESFNPHREEILARLEKLVEDSGSVSVNDNMSIIATVGRGMVHNCGTAARLFSAMSRARINVRMIDQGSSELSIIIAVQEQAKNRIR